MKLCDRCRVAGCLLNYGGKACKNARKQNCPDVVFTNADRVREMNDEELAKFMLSSNGAAYCKNNDRDSTCYCGTHAEEEPRRQQGDFCQYCGHRLREIGRECFCNNVNCQNRYVNV